MGFKHPDNPAKAIAPVIETASNEGVKVDLIVDINSPKFAAIRSVEVGAPLCFRQKCPSDETTDFITLGHLYDLDLTSFNFI